MINESLMDKYIDADESDDDQDFIKQLEEARETSKEEMDGFLKTLQKAKEVLNEQGAFVGLCKHCYGTGKTMVQKMDGYEGIQTRKEDDIITILQCRHGEDVKNNFDF